MARRFELLSNQARPGDTPARFTYVATSSALGGSRAELPEVMGYDSRRILNDHLAGASATMIA